MLIRNLIFFLSLCLLQSISLWGQNQQLKDSITLEIRNTPSDTVRLKVYKEILQEMKYKDYEDLGKTFVKEALILAKKMEQKEFALFFEFMNAKILLVTKTIKSDQAIAVFDQTLEAVKTNRMDKMTYILSFELGRIYHEHIKNSELALEYVLKSTKIFESLKTTTDVQLPYKTLSFMYWLYKKNYTKAKFYAEKNLELSLARNNQYEIGMAYLCLAVTSGSQDNKTKIAYYKKSLNHLSREHHKHDYAMTLYNIANAYSTSGDTKNSLKNFRKSLKLFTENGEVSMPTRIKYILGLIHLENNRSDSAYYYLDQSIRYYTEKKDTDYLSYLKLSIGKVHYKKGQLDQCLKLYFEALQIAEKSKNHENIAIISTRIAAVHKSQNNVQAAISYQEKALQNYIHLKDSSNISATQNNISQLLLVENEYQKSLNLSKKNLKQFISFQDSCQISTSYVIMGKSYFGLKKIDSAKYYLDKGIPLALNCDNIITSSSAYITIGKIYKQKKEDVNALGAFEKALRFAQRARDVESIKNAAKFLYPYYYQKGQYKKAFEILDLYQSRKDSLFNAENTRNLVQKELEYNFEKQQQEQAFLQQQKDVEQQRAIERQQWIIYGAVLACFSFIGLTLLYYRNSQNKKKANTLLNAQNQEIAKQKTALEKLDASKSKLFANISHELRTPLTLISSPIAYMLQDQQNSLTTDQISQLKIVERNTKQLKGLVNDILDLSKLESNRIEIQEDKLQLVSFLRQVFSNFDSLAEHLKINYKIISTIPDHIIVLLDRDKTEKIINNLLSNAIKNTASLGTVEFFSSIEQEFLIIQVKDNGNGIAEKDIPYIFDRFFQGNNTEQSLQGGTGIGLALAKELSQLMNGTITVSSELNRGSTFELRLPYKETDVTDQLLVDISVQQDDVPLIIAKKNNSNHSQKILVVEDHPDMQRFIVQLLDRTYKIYTANNGKQALEVLRKHSIDLIISDVMMPEMDGYQFLKVLKDHDNYNGIPVIMLTALHNIENKLKALTIGVDDYLSKPFLPEELIARVYNLLERYEIRKHIALEIEEEKFKSQTSELLDLNTNKSDSKWLAEVEQIIKNELENENFNISALADQFFISPRQFQRRIKKMTGLAPKKFQIEIALQEARKLLETQSYQTVKAIALTVGMSNVWRFSKLYEQRFGKKPSDYF